MDGDTHNAVKRRIKLLRPLGKGGFGGVFLAEVRSSDGLVHRMAVKLMHAEFSKESEVAARSRDEARLMSQINHDNVVHVFGLSMLGERAAVLMEYVEGIDGAAMIKDTVERGAPGIPLSVVCRMMECAADALDCVYHSISPQTGEPLHVVHRDIKPSNLLVSLTGVLKVMDFGVARAEFEREAVTKSMQFGTQRFMAPERWLEGEAGPRSDVFSLAITFWDLVMGDKLPQMPLSPKKYAARLDADVTSLLAQCQLDKATSEDLESLYRGMMNYDSVDRLSAAEVTEAFSELSEKVRGPSLRRYARKWIPPLLEARESKMEEEDLFADMTGTLYTTRYEDEEDEAYKEDPTLGKELKQVKLGADSGAPPLEASYVRDGFEAVVRTAPKIEAVFGSWKGMVAMPIIGGVLAGFFLHFRAPKVEVSAPAHPQHSVMIYAEPSEGYVEVEGLRGEVGAEISTPEGLREFVFLGDGWQKSCEVEVNAGLATIKFNRDGDGCIKTFR